MNCSDEATVGNHKCFIWTKYTTTGEGKSTETKRRGDRERLIESNAVTASFRLAEAGEKGGGGVGSQLKATTDLNTRWKRNKTKRWRWRAREVRCIMRREEDRPVCWRGRTRARRCLPYSRGQQWNRSYGNESWEREEIKISEKKCVKGVSSSLRSWWRGRRGIKRK